MTTLASIDWASIGILLLAIAALAIVVEGALAAMWALRLSRRAKALNERLKAEQANVRADVVRLQQSLNESVVLWQPYRRLLRFLRHPLMLALMQSYARRRVAPR